MVQVRHHQLVGILGSAVVLVSSPQVMAHQQEPLQLESASVMAEPVIAEPVMAEPDLPAPSAEETSQDSAATEALAEQAQNPIANLISVPFQNNTTLGMGSREDQTLNVLNVQPVVPFRLNDGLSLVTRTILPVLSQPMPVGGTSNGIGDLNPTLFVVPNLPGRWTVGFGPTLVLPTASRDELGSGQWALGPAAVAVVTNGPWVAGGLVNQIWSVAGDSNRRSLSQFLVQPFVNYNLPNGWYLVSSPIITANWQASSDRWLVPIGGGFGRVFRVGSQPVNASLQAYANVAKPDLFGDVTIRAQIQLLFPRP
ncbi:MAG: transporter [Cyanobium sp. M30B3]|nr:MAG: transporter [Cyanobium sp. M30B3]